MTTDSVVPTVQKARKPRLSPEQKLEALLAQQRELEDLIRAERIAAKRRADEAAKIKLLRLAQALVASGLADLEESVLRSELKSLSERLRTNNQPV